MNSKRLNDLKGDILELLISPSTPNQLKDKLSVKYISISWATIVSRLKELEQENKVTKLNLTDSRSVWMKK